MRSTARLVLCIRRHDDDDVPAAPPSEPADARSRRARGGTRAPRGAATTDKGGRLGMRSLSIGGGDGDHRSQAHTNQSGARSAPPEAEAAFEHFRIHPEGTRPASTCWSADQTAAPSSTTTCPLRRPTTVVRERRRLPAEARRRTLNIRRLLPRCSGRRAMHEHREEAVDDAPM